MLELSSVLGAADRVTRKVLSSFSSCCWINFADFAIAISCLLQAINKDGEFFRAMLSMRTWYRNSATSFTSRWNAALSTTNTTALAEDLKRSKS